MMSEEAARIARWEKRVRKREKSGSIRRRNHKWLDKYKLGLECAKCGETNPGELTFHHRDPTTKTTTVAKLMHRSIKRIQKEIDKCMVLCQACHREHHEEEKME